MLAQVPLSFERNAGQAADKSAAWVGRGQGYNVTLGATGATIVPAAPGRSDAVRMTFLNARPQADSSPLAPLPGKTNYLIGADPKRWLRNLPTYGRIEYRDVYDGIDVAWYGGQGQIEYDFTIRPGADPSRIRMSVEGARKLTLDADGAVDIETAAGAMKLRRPQVCQTIAGARRPVQGGFSLEAGNVIGFKLAAYDRTQPLVIDPTLVYGSFLGSGALNIYAVATDALGNVYLAGNAGVGMATVNALQPGTSSAEGDCFVMKLNPAGTAVLYATYIGGSTGSAAINGIAVDSSGELGGTGYTQAADFPLINPAWSTFDAWDDQSAIVLKLSSDGSALVYSTYLSALYSNAIAFDRSGNAYVAGDTFSTGVATSGAYQTVYGGGLEDAFAAKLSQAGALDYFTFLGGSGDDYATAIAVDSAGNAYVAGSTSSTRFSISAPGARTGNAGGYDAFVAKISSAGSSAPWMTFLGGTGDEDLTALARDSSSGILYIAGTTTSADLPTTASALQADPNGPGQGFIASLNPDGMSFGFVTYLGGRKYDSINAMALTPTGQLAIAGTASSDDFPSVAAIQPAFVGNGISFFESANSGASWTAEDAGLPTSIVAITGDPTNANAILALSSAPFSVFRTTNGGSSWTAEPLGPGYGWAYDPPVFVRSPANPAVLYVYLPSNMDDPSSYDFVYRSTNDGATWTAIATPAASAGDLLQGLLPSATDANTLVEVYVSGPVYRSTDGGATFVPLSPLSQGNCQAGLGVAVANGPDGSFYLGSNSTGGICKSTDNGSTWTLLTGSGNIWFPSAIAISPSNPSVLYAIDYPGNLYASPDAGTTWNSATTPGGSVNALAIAPSNSQVVYAIGGDGNVYVSKDGAATWTPASSLPFSPSAIAVSATNPAAVYAGGTSATEGFVAKLNTAGTSLLWSTFYTDGDGSYPWAIASVPSGDVWIAGPAGSADLPITSNAYSKVGSSLYGAAFLARISDTTAPCSYWLNPASMISYGAQSLSFSVTAPSGCAWTATASDNTWIAVNTASGTASGVVSATLTANTTASTRTGSVSVNGQSFAITQASASCKYSVSTPTTVPSSGGTVEITVTASAGCPWSVMPLGPGITVVSGGSGTGNGTVTLSMAPNVSVQWLGTSVQVGPKKLTLSVADDCTYSLTPTALGAAAQSGSISVTASPAGCYWYPQSDAPWLSVPYNTATGSGTFSYTAAANPVRAARTAHITLDGQQFTVTQTAANNVLAVGGAAGTSSLTLANSGAWTATANDPFLHISSGSAGGTGNATVAFGYDAFTATGSRSGTLTVAGQTVTVEQAGTNYIGPFGPGPAVTVVSSGLWDTMGIAMNGSGILYIADTAHNAIKEWNPATGQMVTLVSSGLNTPFGVAVDLSGNVYIADTVNNAIKEWNAATQQVTTLASGLNYPEFLAVDGSGNVYFSDYMGGDLKEWSTATQQVTTLAAQTSGLVGPAGVALDGSGNVYIANLNNTIGEWNAATQQVTTLVGLGLSSPTGVAVDGSGNVFFSDTNNHAIKAWSASTQQVTTLVASGLKSPDGLALDFAGNIYIADNTRNEIYEIPRAFVGPASLTEPAADGSDSLLPVLPSTAPLTGDFAATSDQNWLTIGSIANGAVGFAFAANSGATRVAHISILGQQITVVQNGATNGTAAQTVTFGPLANQVLGTPSITLHATASSGLPVSFSSLTTPVCTVSGLQLTLLAAGTCTIQAEQAGNAIFGAAPPVNQSLTIVAAGTQAAISGVISAGAFGAFPAAAPGTWVEIYGSNFSATTRGWTGADFNGTTAPTSLSGLQVTIGGQAAFLDYISPTQVNAQLPSGIGPGTLPLTVSIAGIPSAPVNLTVNATEPGLLAPPSFQVGGKQYVVAQFSDGSFVLPSGAIPGLTTRPAKPGETIVIYGIGFGPVVPGTPAGQLAPSSSQLAAPVQFLFGGTPAQRIPYSGLTPGLIGLYQFNIVVPQVPDNTLLPLTFTLGGVAGTQTLYTAVHQ